MASSQPSIRRTVAPPLLGSTSACCSEYHMRWCAACCAYNAPAWLDNAGCCGRTAATCSFSIPCYASRGVPTVSAVLARRSCAATNCAVRRASGVIDCVRSTSPRRHNATALAVRLCATSRNATLVTRVVYCAVRLRRCGGVWRACTPCGAILANFLLLSLKLLRPYRCRFASFVSLRMPTERKKGENWR